MGADEVGQHLVHVGEYAFQELPLRFALDERQADVAEGAAILEKERGQDRDYDQEPDILRNFGDPNSDPLSQNLDLIAVITQKLLQLLPGGLGEALRADLVHNFARAYFLQQVRRGFPKLGALMTNLRPYECEKDNDQDYEEDIDDRNGSTSAFDPLFELGNQGIDQIREEDGEEKSDQSVAGGVEETQAQREQQHRHRRRRGDGHVGEARQRRECETQNKTRARKCDPQTRRAAKQREQEAFDNRFPQNTRCPRP